MGNWWTACEFILDAPGRSSLFCGTPTESQRYRARRVYSLAKMIKRSRLGLVRATENDHGSVTIHGEDSDGPLIPDQEDLERGEASYRAAEERGDLPW